MVMNGLTDNEKTYRLQLLSNGKRLKSKSDKSISAKAYSATLREMTSAFDNALKEKNFIKLLDLEAVAQKHDAEYFSHEPQKSLELYTNLNTLKKMFLDGLDPEKVQRQFLPSVEDLNAFNVRVIDRSFATLVRSQSRSLAAFFGNRSTQAERDYYEKRQDCLIAIGREHQKNIDRAMGYSKDKKKDKELSQNKGLSR